MYCPNCGRKIPANTQFCPYCDYHIKFNSINPNQQIYRRQSNYRMPPTQLSSTPKRHHKKVIWAIVAVIIIIAAGFGYHQYKQSPMSVNLATTMPGHNWKIHYNTWDGHYENNHFSSHSISEKKDNGNVNHFHVSYGKNHFDLHDSGLVMRFNLQRIHGKNYYFKLGKIHGITGSYSMSSSGNAITYYYNNGKTAKIIKNGNKLTVTSGSRHKTFYPTENDGTKELWDMLDHKTFKIVKE